jgi:hypothetical protein
MTEPLAGCYRGLVQVCISLIASATACFCCGVALPRSMQIRCCHNIWFQQPQTCQGACPLSTTAQANCKMCNDMQGRVSGAGMTSMVATIHESLFSAIRSDSDDEASRKTR